MTYFIHGLIVSNTNHYGQEAFDMQWKWTRYNPKEADIEIDMLCSFFRRKSCISLTDHYKDVVEDPLWQVHVNMLEVPSSECLPSDKSWEQIALIHSLSAPNDEAMMPS